MSCIVIIVKYAYPNHIAAGKRSLEYKYQILCQFVTHFYDSQLTEQCAGSRGKFWYQLKFMSAQESQKVCPKKVFPTFFPCILYVYVKIFSLVSSAFII